MSQLGDFDTIENMNTLCPPPPPTSTVALDDRGPERLRLRLQQLSWTIATVAVTGWFCTFGALSAILAIAVAKHILVAIVVMGVGMDVRRVKS